MRIIFHGLAAAGLLCLATFAAPAAAQDDHDYCDNLSGQFTHAVAIAGCTALIEAGRLPSENLAIVYYNRGNAYYAQQDYPQAVADYSAAIRLNPQYMNPYNNRGNAYRALRDYPRAIADLSQAIRLNPQFGDAYFNRALAYEGQRDWRRAIADYGAAIRLNPRDAGAYTNRGNAYERLGNRARAAADRAAAARLSGQ
jgi:tetratricopeptide (TPR) repeat protein